jgi:hypothetical protein
MTTKNISAALSESHAAAIVSMILVRTSPYSYKSPFPEVGANISAMISSRCVVSGIKILLFFSRSTQLDDNQRPGHAVIALTTSVIVPKRCGDDKHKHNVDQKSRRYNCSDGRHENRLLSFTSTVGAIS